MCQCSSVCDCSDYNTSILPQGDPGDQGEQGLFGGFSAEWAFSTSTSSGPSSTQLRFNNSTYSSVTVIYVSDTGTGSIDMDSFLDSLSNNSKFGYIRIFKKDDSTKFWVGQITAVTDNGSDHSLTVTYISHNSSFSNTDEIVLTFSPAGSGAVSVLNNNTTPVSTANAAFTTLLSYTIPANQMNNNGDVIEVIAAIDTNLIDEVKRIRVRLGGTVAHSKLAYFPIFRAEKYMRLCMKISRQSSTTVFLEFLVTVTNDLYQETSTYALFETGFSVSDLSTNTTLIEVQAQNIDATPVETISDNQLLVTYQNKV